MKRLLSVVLCVVVAGVAFGVGSVEVSQAAGPVSATDSAGRTRSFHTHPTRVVSGAPGITEMIYALGKGDLLVGRTDFCDYPAEVATVPSIGNLTDPSVEQIVALEPDVMLVSTHFQRDVATTLEDLGIPVLYYFTPESFEATYEIIQAVGALLDAETEAERITSGMQADVRTVTDAVATVERRPSVYYVIDFGQWGDFTAGGDTFVGRLIDMAGGKNIAADLSGWAYSLEKIVEADPEMVICSAYYDSKARLQVAEGYKDLTAVKEGRLYEFDNNLIDRQGPRLAQGLRALAEIFHPELF